MKKIISIVFLFLVSFSSVCDARIFQKKQKPTLILSPYDPREVKYEAMPQEASMFKTGERIYFFIYVPEGFKSQYIKYQIVKQDDNAYVGGFTRERNVTVKVKDKNSYVDYFVINQKGKYFIQIFDITDVHHWLAIGAFRVLP